MATDELIAPNSVACTTSKETEREREWCWPRLSRRQQDKSPEIGGFITELFGFRTNRRTRGRGTIKTSKCPPSPSLPPSLNEMTLTAHEDEARSGGRIHDAVEMSRRKHVQSCVCGSRAMRRRHRPPSRRLPGLIFSVVVVLAAAIALRGGVTASNPLELNGGSCLAMAGKDCVALAVDRRFGLEGQLVSTEAKRVLKVRQASDCRSTNPRREHIHSKEQQGMTLWSRHRMESATRKIPLIGNQHNQLVSLSLEHYQSELRPHPRCQSEHGTVSFS